MPQLNRYQHRILRAFAEALFFDGEEPVPAARLDWLAQDIDDYYDAISETGRTALRVGLVLIQFSPPLMLGQFRRLTSLPVGARVACLERIEQGPLAPLLVIIKVLVASVYFEHPDALAETGFQGMALHGERPDRPLDPLLQ